MRFVTKNIWRLRGLGCGAQEESEADCHCHKFIKGIRRHGEGGGSQENQFLLGSPRIRHAQHSPVPKQRKGNGRGEYATHRLLMCPLCLACQANSPGKWEIRAPGQSVSWRLTVILVGSLPLSQGLGEGRWVLTETTPPFL